MPRKPNTSAGRRRTDGERSRRGLKRIAAGAIAGVGGQRSARHSSVGATQGMVFHKPNPEVLHAPPPPTILRHQPDPPAVVLSCERCGFDYTITRVEISGRPGVVWTCECGSEFIPPGGPESFNLVRP